MPRFGFGPDQAMLDLWNAEYDRFGARVRLDTYMDALTEQVSGFSLQVAGGEMLDAAAQAYLDGKADGFSDLGAFYQRAYRDRRGTWVKDYEALGFKANAAAHRQYSKLHKGIYPEDRTFQVNRARNRRYGGGKMDRAILDPRMYRAFGDGIAWGNQDWLWTNARQWRRLNYGTTGAGGVAPQVDQMTFLGKPVDRRGYSDHTPSPGFSIPRGVWDGNKFTPISELVKGKIGEGTQVPPRVGQVLSRRTGTKGISAMQFMDAGANYLVQRFPRLLERQLTDVFQFTYDTAGRQGAAAAIAMDRTDIDQAFNLLNSTVVENAKKDVFASVFKNLR